MKDREFRSTPRLQLRSDAADVDGILYTTAGSRRNVAAIDGTNGETLWMWRFDEGTCALRSPRFNSGCGVAYWTDGQDERNL